MLCDICGKNPATVHLTEIINGEVKELHLCEECALKKSQEMQKAFSLGDILSSLIEGTQPQEKESLLRCSRCGLTYEEFRKIGRLGCAYCYISFRTSLWQLIKAIHGSTFHSGKIPKAKESFRIDVEIEELKKKLRRAIELEEFEEAAAIRDKIKELEKKKK